MVSIPLRQALRMALLIAVCGSHTAGLALPPGDTTSDESTTPFYRTHLDYDQLSARVPRELAPIASVVVARINIEMHRARQIAGQQLCSGQWSPQGAVLIEVGPLLLQSKVNDTRNSPWIYQSYRHPRALHCGDTSRAEFFQELSRHLPDWITIRPGGQATAFRGGIPIATN